MSTSLLEVHDLAVYKDGTNSIISKVNLKVNQGDVIVLRGASGCGYVGTQELRNHSNFPCSKTTLLKCLAHLDLYSGEILYKGKPPQKHGTLARYS